MDIPEESTVIPYTWEWLDWLHGLKGSSSASILTGRQVLWLRVESLRQKGKNREAWVSSLHHRLWGSGFRQLVRSCEETGALCLQAGASFWGALDLGQVGLERMLAVHSSSWCLAWLALAPSPCLYSSRAPFTSLLWCPWLVHFSLSHCFKPTGLASMSTLIFLWYKEKAL